MSGVLLILADDMRADLLRYMPFTSGVLRSEGTEFTRAHCSVPNCQAARVALLTGQHALQTGIYGNADQTEWATGYTNTIGTWAQTAGATTGVFGKLPNGYRQSNVRPGWDTWRIYDANEQEAYTYNLTDGVGGSATPGTHQLPTVAALVSTFCTDTAGDWFAWWNPTNPHITTSTLANNPLPGTMSRYGWVHWDFDLLTDADIAVTTKPTWIEGGHEFTYGDLSLMRSFVRQQIRECYDLDQAIAGLYADLEADGTLEDTTIIFCSDGGVFYGEHRQPATSVFLAGKDSPYAPAAHIPLIIRGPGFPAGRTESTAVTLQDVTATILDVLGATDTIGPDGTSLVGIVAQPDPDRAVLYERSAAGDFPDAQGVFTSTHTMVRYVEGTGTPAIDFTANPTDEYELYAVGDRGQKVNLAYEGGDSLTIRNALEASLDLLLS